MNKRKYFFQQRDKLAFEMGLLILGYADYCADFENRKVPVPEKERLAFKGEYEKCLNRYIDLCKELKPHAIS